MIVGICPPLKLEKSKGGIKEIFEQPKTWSQKKDTC